MVSNQSPPAVLVVLSKTPEAEKYEFTVPLIPWVSSVESDITTGREHALPWYAFSPFSANSPIQYFIGSLCPRPHEEVAHCQST